MLLLKLIGQRVFVCVDGGSLSIRGALLKLRMIHNNMFWFLSLFIFMITKIVSYNSHGLGPEKVDYISKLSSVYDFILVQEHWLIEQNLGLFQEKIPGITLWCLCY